MALIQSGKSKNIVVKYRVGRREGGAGASKPKKDYGDIESQRANAEISSHLFAY